MDLNPPYFCKNGHIDDMSELLLIKGITPDIYWGPTRPIIPFPPFNSMAAAPSIPTHAQLQRRGLPQLRPAPISGRPGGIVLAPWAASSTSIPLRPHAAIDPRHGRGRRPAYPARRAPARTDRMGRMTMFRCRIAGEISDFLWGRASQTASWPTTLMCAVMSSMSQSSLINGYHRTFHGIVSRGGGGGQQINCVKFYWE